MQLWAKTLGLKGGSYRQVGVDHFDKEAPGGLGREAAEGWAYQGEFGYDGGDPDVVHPKDVSFLIFSSCLMGVGFSRVLRAD